MADFQPSAAERVLLGQGTHIVEMQHGYARVVACSEFPEKPTKGQVRPSDTQGTTRRLPAAPRGRDRVTNALAGRKSITIAEARTLGLIP